MKLLAICGFAIASAALGWGESLNFTVRSDAGVALGEVVLHSEASKEDPKRAWNFDADMNVSVPGYQLRDQYRSSATSGLCSSSLDKEIVRGEKKVTEHVTFDQERLMVKREIVGGSAMEYTAPQCARDAMVLLHFIRKELAEGRLAAQQTMIFGVRYEVRFDYRGVQRVKTGSKQMEAECLRTTVKGPASETTFDVYFARDAVRTPVMARITVPAGTFVLELAR